MWAELIKKYDEKNLIRKDPDAKLINRVLAKDFIVYKKP